MARKLEIEEVKRGDYVTAKRVSKGGKQYEFTGQVRDISDWGLVIKIPGNPRSKKISLRLYDLTKSSKRNAEKDQVVHDDKPAIQSESSAGKNNWIDDEIRRLEKLQQCLEKIDNAKGALMNQDIDAALKLFKGVVEVLEA